MKRFEFQLDISPEQYLPYYRGSVRQVQVHCQNGQIARFPAALLQRFVQADGIHGYFELSCDDDLRGAKLTRLPD